MSEEERSLATVTPATSLDGFKGDVNSMMQLVKEQMHVNQDYGEIPGTKGKKTLFDPGAEKLAKFFGLVPQYEKVKEVEDFEKGFYYYTYKCTLTHFKTGKFAGAAERSCNSFEKKYLYSYGNSRNTPEQLTEKINTIQAMAQKRAFVEAVKTATMASELFIDTQVKDTAPNGPVTKQDYPARVSLLEKLFVTASERGFSQQEVRETMHKKYKVDTIGKVTDKDIADTIENLTLKFDVVGKGQKPKPMNQTPPPAPPTQPAASPSSPVEEGEVVMDEIDQDLGITPEEKKQEEERKKKVSIEQVATPSETESPLTDDAVIECRNDYKKIKKGTAYNGWYCNKECNDQYWLKNSPRGKRNLSTLLDAGKKQLAAEQRESVV